MHVPCPKRSWGPGLRPGARAFGPSPTMPAAHWCWGLVMVIGCPALLSTTTRPASSCRTSPCLCLRRGSDHHAPARADGSACTSGSQIGWVYLHDGPALWHVAYCTGTRCGPGMVRATIPPPTPVLGRMVNGKLTYLSEHLWPFSSSMRNMAAGQGLDHATLDPMAPSLAITFWRSFSSLSVHRFRAQHVPDYKREPVVGNPRRAPRNSQTGTPNRHGTPHQPTLPGHRRSAQTPVRVTGIAPVSRAG